MLHDTAVWRITALLQNKSRLKNKTEFMPSTVLRLFRL